MIFCAGVLTLSLVACENTQKGENKSETGKTEQFDEMRENAAQTVETSENAGTSEDTQTDSSVPGHEHAYTKEVTKEPTCDDDGQGEITYTCSGCGDTYTEETERIDHCTDDIKVIQEATCSQVGIKTYSCIFCGREFEREELPKLPHTESDFVRNFCGGKRSF